MDFVDYGVCRLSVVPIRSTPADASELISQLLFGEHYSVLKTSDDRKWCYVQNAFDDYQGWIDIKQHNSISKAFFDQISNSEYKICTDLFSRILYKKEVVHVTVGAVLPLLSNPLFEMEEQLAFTGEAKSLHRRWNAEQLINLAKKYLNAPYLWGGKTPLGIDCSGFTQQVFKVAGYQLKRDSSEQVLQGNTISLDDALPSDLAFFTNQDGKMNHVGIVLKDGEVIHASGKVRIDQIDQKGIFSHELNAYTHNLFKVKRILKEGT